jgi:hypothetical protein
MRASATTHVLRGLVLGAVLLTAAGCGDHPATPGKSPSQSSESASPSTGPSQGAAVTISGVIIEGLRPTCRVLETATQRYALVGPGTAELKEGDRVTVTGTEQPGAHNPCGVAFLVTHLRTTTAGG